ncbi:hypothetical protein JCM33374_g2264 [Metschnikowia sp. JCM 33374]|nr:hypothetical protein JCM33374_g2264 [Metschnikowia sp. JCM 33374]
MHLFIVLSAISTVLAITNILYWKPEYTVIFYNNPPPVLSLFQQNPYLCLPNAPAEVVEGTDEVYVSVPVPLHQYVWELTGFYRAKRTGHHMFLVDGARVYSIQLGSKSTTSRAFHRIIVDETEVLTGISKPYHLTQGTYYALKLTYVAEDKRRPVLVIDPNGVQETLADEICQVYYDEVADPDNPGAPSRGVPLYYNAGFYFQVYLAPDRERSLLLRTYDHLHLVYNGYFEPQMRGVRVSAVQVSCITEIVGHFQPPKNDSYKFAIAGGSSLLFGIQIGPGVGHKNSMYTIDSTWRVLHSRISGSADFSLRGDLHYPFRIVVLGNPRNLRNKMTSYDSAGRMVDLFGIHGPPG